MHNRSVGADSSSKPSTKATSESILVNHIKSNKKSRILSDLEVFRRDRKRSKHSFLGFRTKRRRDNWKSKFSLIWSKYTDPPSYRSNAFGYDQHNDIMSHFMPGVDTNVPVVDESPSHGDIPPGMDPIRWDRPEDCGRIVGKYKLSGTLGSGSFGAVYLGRHIVSKKEVAIKVVERCLSDPDVEEEAISEAKMLRTHCHHPNITTLHQALIGRFNVYLVLERGMIDLETLINSTDVVTKQPDLIQQVMLGSLMGLKHLHERGVAHLDLHPGNIMISLPDSHGLKRNSSMKGKCWDNSCHIDQSHIRLCDFGHARALIADMSVEDKLPDDEGVCGQPNCGKIAYTAPEANAYNIFEVRLADIWSLGCVLWDITQAFPRRCWMDYSSYDETAPNAYASIIYKEVNAMKKQKMTDEGDVLMHDLLFNDLLVPKYWKRATAAQALQHPWFEFTYPVQQE